MHCSNEADAVCNYSGIHIEQFLNYYYLLGPLIEELLQRG